MVGASCVKESGDAPYARPHRFLLYCSNVGTYSALATGVSFTLTVRVT